MQGGLRAPFFTQKLDPLKRNRCEPEERSKDATVAVRRQGQEMDHKFLKEFGLHLIVGALVFGWIFSQALSTTPSRTRAPTEALPKSDKRGDNLPSAPKAKLSEIKITIEPAALEPPDTASVPQSPLLEVTATKLRLRTHPTTRSSWIKVYPIGATFEQLGQYGDWLNVRNTADGASGWMHGDYLRATDRT